MKKTKLIRPHGSDELKILLLEGSARKAELKRAESLPKEKLAELKKISKE